MRIWKFKLVSAKLHGNTAAADLRAIRISVSGGRFVAAEFNAYFQPLRERHAGIF